MALEPLHLAMLCVHTSPAAALGGSKTGGMNVYVREIAREMGRRGIRVDIFTRVSDPSEQNKVQALFPNVRLVYLPCGAPAPMNPDTVYLHLNEFRDALLDFAKDERYDAIYSHYWLSGWVGLQLRVRWRVPMAQMFHTLGRMKNRIALTPSMDDARVRGESEIIRHAERIIAATPAERAQLLLLYRANRRKIDIVPPGVDLRHFTPGNRAEALANVGWNPARKHLLFVGRIEPLKGIDLIFEALAHIRQHQPALLQNLCLNIVGGDPASQDEEMRRLLVLREMLELGQHIDFIGARGQDTLPDYYRAAEALVMPSDYESFGMVALEAMACGTPVIASEVGGLAFLIEDGKTGFHIPTREPAALAERITALASAPALRDSMGRAAHDAAQGYSWSKIADQLLAVFTMLGTRPRIYTYPP